MNQTYVFIFLAGFVFAAVVAGVFFLVVLGQRKRAQQRLAENLSLLSSLLNAIPAPVSLRNRDGLLMGGNKALADLLGIPSDSIKGTNMKKVLPRSAADVFLGGDEQAMTFNNAGGASLTIEDAKGTARTFLLYKNAVRDENGQPTGIVDVLMDVTEAQKARDELRKGRESLLSILQNAPYGIMVRRRDLSVSFVNAKFTEITGYTLEDVERPLSWFEQAYPDTLSRQKAMETWASDAGRPGVKRVFSIQCADGQIRELEFMQSVLVDGRYVIAMADVTETQRMARALSESEKKYKAYMDSAPVGIMVFDGGGRILEANPAMARLTGYALQDLAGMHLARIIHKNHSPHSMLELLSLMGHGTWEWTIVRDKGEVVDAVITAITLNSGQFLAFVMDVTDRVRMEKEILRAKEAAEQASKAKSVFLANMSHEIRTPINGIIGIAEIMLMNETNSEQREYLSLTRKSAKTLLEVVGDILDLSRIEAGRLKLRPTDFNIRDLAHTAMAVMEVEADKKGLKMEARIAPEVPKIVVADPTRLKQVLLNLLSNAVKFTDEGTVSMEVLMLEQDADDPSRQDGLSLLTRVSDTGIGIPDDKMAAIFDSFTQARSDTDREHEGAGLGLTISRQLVGMMGGKMWAHAGNPRGSVFNFTIPVLLPDEESLPEPPPPPAGQPVSRHILVVEDNMINLLALSKYLEAKGCRVTGAANGIEALEALKKERADLVLMDIQMPVMDGVACAREIRQGAAGQWARNIPIIALTAYAMEEDRTRVMEAGMDGHLSKPVDYDVMLERIIALLEERSRA